MTKFIYPPRKLPNRSRTRTKVSRPHSTANALAPGSFLRKRFDCKKTIGQAPHEHSGCKISIHEAPRVHSGYKKCIHQAPHVHSDCKKWIDQAAGRHPLQQRPGLRQIAAKSKLLGGYPARCQSWGSSWETLGGSSLEPTRSLLMGSACFCQKTKTKANSNNKY